MKLVIEINVDNAAYSDGNIVNELKENLNNVLNRLFHGDRFGKISDTNGNKVGKYELRSK